MDGVTILNEFTAMNDYFFIVPLSIAVVGLIVTIIGSVENDPASFVGALILVLFAPLTAGAIASSYATRYEALVDSTVSAEALMEHYEVIERKGDIWVLEPLEEKSDDSV